IERSVLDEMGVAELSVLFEHRSGIHNQSKLGALLGLQVALDVVAQTVRQLADPDLRIKWESGRKIGGGRGFLCICRRGDREQPCRETGGGKKTHEGGVRHSRNNTRSSGSAVLYDRAPDTRAVPLRV